MTLYQNRDKFKNFSIKVGVLFSKLRLSPNTWTIISLIPILISLWFLVRSDYLPAAIFFIISAFLDIVDGSVARVTGRVSKFGAYLDTVVDRYVEAIIIFALLFAALPVLTLPYLPAIPMAAWLYLYFFGSIMTTYVKAAAKEKEIIGQGNELKGGLLERADRMILLFIGILAAVYDPLFLSGMVILLAVLSNVSALQRMWKARKLATAV